MHARTHGPEPKSRTTSDCGKTNFLPPSLPSIHPSFIILVAPKLCVCVINNYVHIDDEDQGMTRKTTLCLLPLATTTSIIKSNGFSNLYDGDYDEDGLAIGTQWRCTTTNQSILPMFPFNSEPDSSPPSHCCRRRLCTRIRTFSGRFGHLVCSLDQMNRTKCSIRMVIVHFVCLLAIWL